MTEKEFLETKINHLKARRSLMIAEIDFKLKLLEDALALQKGFEVGGKYNLRFELYGEG